jgi:hypothetical protein
MVFVGRVKPRVRSPGPGFRRSLKLRTSTCGVPFCTDSGARTGAGLREGEDSGTAPGAAAVAGEVAAPAQARVHHR